MQLPGGPQQFFKGVDDRGESRFSGLLPGDYYVQTSDTNTARTITIPALRPG